jgi:GPI-anchor transamidase subunit GAA1
VNDKLETIFKSIGLKVGRQNYTYYSSGDTYTGENVYAILQAPRGDATEAIVLVAAWKTINDDFNRNGLALALALMRYFKRWSLWSKDIILVVPPNSRAGTQAWVDAYHDGHDSSKVASLPIKSGALQGAVAIDYPSEGRFEGVHIIYDGINGQLPNLDLINSVVNIASGQMGMGSTIQQMWQHSDKYPDRLKTMLCGMLNQGLGHAAGPHSSFIPYHVDAITIQPIGNGWHDEMGLGRLVEGTFRSLNNLLEHLHQSFFFYLLMHKERFVSIGTYLPSAMLIAANFTIMAICLWVKSGYVEGTTFAPKKLVAQPTRGATDAKVEEDASNAGAAERDLFVPLGIVTASQFLGFIPLFVFSHAPANVSHFFQFLRLSSFDKPAYTTSQLLSPLFFVFTGVTVALPVIASACLTSHFTLTAQQYQLLSSFSLLFLGMFLSALATLNFSLAFLIGLLSTPLSFAQLVRSSILKYGYFAILAVLSPGVVISGAAVISGVGVDAVLKEAAFGWDVWAMYTPLVVWCVWWPAWIVGSVVVLGPVDRSKVKRA